MPSLDVKWRTRTATPITAPQPKNLADALIQLLKSRGLTDEADLTVLGQVIVESSGYRVKWSTPAPTVTEETRQQLAERLGTSERLRRVLRELGYDPDELTEVEKERASETNRGES